MAIINKTLQNGQSWTASADCIVDINGGASGAVYFQGNYLPPSLLEEYGSARYYYYSCKGFVIAKGGVVALRSSTGTSIAGQITITGFTLS